MLLDEMERGTEGGAAMMAAAVVGVLSLGRRVSISGV